jgi:hypothetical protein
MSVCFDNLNFLGPFLCPALGDRCHLLKELSIIEDDGDTNPLPDQISYLFLVLFDSDIVPFYDSKDVLSGESKQHLDCEA